MAIRLAFDARGLTVLVCYMLLCICVGGAGLWKRVRARAEPSVQEHFLAGAEGLPTAVLLGSLFAQTLSGWAMLGYPAEAFHFGLVAVRWLPASVCIIVGFLVVTPRLYRIGRPRRFITTSDFIAARFGTGALHVSVTLACLLPTVFYVLIQFKSMSAAISALSAGAISPRAGAVVAACVMLSYDFLGGMRSVAWLDCVQALLMLLSFFMMLYLADDLFGGVASAMRELAHVSPQRTATPSADEARRHWSTCVLMLSFSLYPHQAARTFAASSAKGLRTAVAAMAFHPFLTQGLCLMLGWAATPSLLPSLPVADSDELIFAVMGRLMEERGDAGYWICVLLMCALIAAMMSTADSGLMALAAIISRDLVGTYSAAARRRSARQQLALAKLITAAACALLVLISSLDMTILGLAALQQQILSQAVPSVWLGLHLASVRRGPLLLGMAVGLGTTAFILLRAGSFGALLWGVHPGNWGLLANFGAVGCGSAYERFYDDGSGAMHASGGGRGGRGSLLGGGACARSDSPVDASPPAAPPAAVAAPPPRPALRTARFVGGSRSSPGLTEVPPEEISLAMISPAAATPPAAARRVTWADGGRGHSLVSPGVGAPSWVFSGAAGDCPELHFGDPRAPREPARSWPVTVAMLALVVATVPFWRGAGEQDEVGLVLQLWAERSALTSFVLAVLVALAIRFGWELPQGSMVTPLSPAADPATATRSPPPPPPKRTDPSPLRHSQPRPSSDPVSHPPSDAAARALHERQRDERLQRLAMASRTCSSNGSGVEMDAGASRHAANGNGRSTGECGVAAVEGAEAPPMPLRRDPNSMPNSRGAAMGAASSRLAGWWSRRRTRLVDEVEDTS